MGDIAVLAKAALDVGQLKKDPSTNTIRIHDTPLKMSDIDRNALEEGVKHKSALGGKVVVFSAVKWGPFEKREKQVRQVVLEALAMGADEAVIITGPVLEEGDQYVTAKVLSAAIRNAGSFDLIITGEGTIDGFSGTVGARVASEMGLPYLPYVKKLEVKNGRIRAVLDMEDYEEEVEANLPAVVSVTREINVPRLPTLIQITRASRKPIKVVKADELGVDVQTLVKRSKIELLQVSRKQVIIEGETLDEKVEKLITYLREEGVLKL